MSFTVEYLVPFSMTILLAFTFHEFAHAWTAWKLGDDTAERQGRVSLNPFVHLDPVGTILIFVTQGFGWARPVPVNPSRLRNPRRDEILVTAAGPASNLVLAVLAGLLLGFLTSKGLFSEAQFKAVPLLKLLRDFLWLMLRLNLLLTFFNLLPIFPLDGSHIVTRLLPLNQAFQFRQFGERYGFWVLIGVVVLGSRLPNHLNPIYWLVLSPSAQITKLLLGIPW